MRNPQVLNLNTSQDSRIAIDGYDVIKDSDQSLLSGGVWAGSPITVSMSLMDLTSGAASALFEDLAMTYDSDSDFWFINLNQGTPNLKDTLVDRKKYVAKVFEQAVVTADMRDFKIHEFSIDNDSFEDTLMRLPFRIEIGTPSKMVWYSDETWVTAIWEANLYEGEGSSITNATDASRVTSRGPIIAA